MARTRAAAGRAVVELAGADRPIRGRPGRLVAAQALRARRSGEQENDPNGDEKADHQEGNPWGPKFIPVW
jgi:hypothetical protein